VNDDSDIQISIPYEFKNTIASPFQYEHQFTKGKVINISEYNADPIRQDRRGSYVVIDAKFDVRGVIVTLRPVNYDG